MRVESRVRREAPEDSIRRAAVVATDTAAQEETLAALRSHGWSVVGVDAVVEDPFTDVAELTRGIDLSGIDVVLRAANRDPFGLLPEVRCAHGASSMVGLCWTAAEPLADRMIHRRNRIVVTGADSSGIDVTCDAGAVGYTRPG